MQQNAPFWVLLKKNFFWGWVGGTPDPLPLLVSQRLACMRMYISNWCCYQFDYVNNNQFRIPEQKV